MAEGGHENPFDPDTLGEGGHGDDEAGEEIPMGQRVHPTDTPAGTFHHRNEGYDEGEAETSFDGDTETTHLIPRERARDEAWEAIKSKFPRFDPKSSPFTAKIGDHGEVVVTLKRMRGKSYPLFGGDGELNPRLPKTIRNSLGESATDVLRENDQERTSIWDRLKGLRAAPHVDEDDHREIERLEAEDERLEAENEAIEERMSLWSST